jgi:hypothetical protein
MDDKARADSLQAANIMLRADNDRLHDEFTCLLENSHDEELDRREEAIYLKKLLLELRKQACAKPSAIAFESRTILTKYAFSFEKRLAAADTMQRKSVRPAVSCRDN